MKIICEYCGASIETYKDSKCPNCHAPYKDNKEFKERLEKLKKKEELDLEMQEIANEASKINNKINTMRSDPLKTMVLLVGIIILVHIVIIGVPLILSTLTATSYFRSNIKKVVPTQATTTTTLVVNKKVEVNKGEFADTNEYRVKVDKIQSLDSIYGVVKPSEGKKYKVFHLIVENKLDKTLIVKEKIDCVVDGFVQKETYYYSKYPKLPTYISGELKAEGYVIFEVPNDAKKYAIKYGKYVTINIEE